VLLARPRSEECSARQGPRTRAREGARGRQQDRSRQAQRDGRVRQIRVQHGRGPGGPAVAWRPRGGIRSGGVRPVRAECPRAQRRSTDPAQRATTTAASAHRPGRGCAQRTHVPGTVARSVRPSEAAGSQPSGPHARSGRQAGERPRHRGRGRRGTCLGAQGRAGGRGQGRSGRPHPGCRTPGAAAPGRRWLASTAARPERGPAASGFTGRGPSLGSGCTRRTASRPRRWRTASAGSQPG
jgi:hypothetical protein